MFLLLAPSLLTGKRPGLYCPGGRRSQDAPKGPKGEVRGWIGRHDKEPPPTTTTHAPLKKQNIQIASFSLSLVTSSFIRNPSHYQESQEMKSGQCPD